MRLATALPGLSFIIAATMLGSPAHGVPFTLSHSITGDDIGEIFSLSGNNVLVGTPEHADGFANVGRAHLFDVASGSLIHTFDNPSLSGPAGIARDDFFGFAVALDGNRALIGSPGSKNDAGQAFVFDTATGNLVHTFEDPSPQTSFPPPFATRGGFFGSSVAIDGNVSIVGNPGHGASGPAREGETHKFFNDTGNRIAAFDPPGSFSSSSVFLKGNDLLITSSGLRVDLIRASSGFSLQTFFDPLGRSSATSRFGEQIEIDGNNVLIGSSGAVFQFDATTGDLLRTFTDPTVPDGNRPSGGFGKSLAVDGLTVAIGETGHVHLFDLSDGELLQTLDAPGPISSFGEAVALEDDLLLVGDSFSDAIHVYTPASGSDGTGSEGDGNDDTKVTSVPEPSALPLLAAAAFWVGLLRRRKSGTAMG